MNTITLAILLQLAGVVVIIAEIIIPSAGILSVIATGLIGYSLFIVFQELSMGLGVIFAGADLITIPILIYFGINMLAKSPATLNKQLSSSDGVTSQVPEMEGYIGKSGKTITDLHPSGTALIENKRLDAVSRGEYIEKEKTVQVISVTGNQIIVQEEPNNGG